MEYAVRCVLAIELKAARPALPADVGFALRSHVDDTMRELEHRWIAGSNVELDLASSEASFTVAVEAGDPQRAMSKAWGVLSMAVHAAGGATSHRPFPQDAHWSVRLVRAKAGSPERQDRAAVFA
jgi:hypothetical protein